jgi:hypothetical protein
VTLAECPQLLKLFREARDKFLGTRLESALADSQSGIVAFHAVSSDIMQQRLISRDIYVSLDGLKTLD